VTRRAWVAVALAAIGLDFAAGFVAPHSVSCTAVLPGGSMSCVETAWAPWVWLAAPLTLAVAACVAVARLRADARWRALTIVLGAALLLTLAFRLGQFAREPPAWPASSYVDAAALACIGLALVAWAARSPQRN
jgi:hypothetical protein